MSFNIYKDLNIYCVYSRYIVSMKSQNDPVGKVLFNLNSDKQSKAWTWDVQVSGVHS